jgi:FkbM family methyltransferase
VKRQGFPASFVMHGYSIALFGGDVRFNPPEKSDEVSHTLLDKPSTEARAIAVPVKKLESILKELGHDRIDLLKMDIEGAEYDVIDDMLKSKIKPFHLLLQFHYRFKDVGVGKSKDAIRELRANGYRLIRVSSSHEEFGFVYPSR